MARDRSAATPPVAIVTGGAAGIGRAACEALARDGFAVVVADINAGQAEDVATAINRNGGSASAVRCNVGSDADWCSAIERAGEMGRLTVLVSNAAIFPRMAFADTTLADFDRVMTINLRGAFLGVQHSAPVIRANGGGACVMMTSGSGQISAVADPMQRGFALYGASKAALDRWALGIAPELAALSIAINVLCPGAVVMTEGVSRLALGDEAPAERISPERVAEAIAYLAARRPPADTGGRFVAKEFGETWGRS